MDGSGVASAADDAELAMLLRENGISMPATIPVEDELQDLEAKVDSDFAGSVDTSSEAMMDDISSIPPLRILFERSAQNQARVREPDFERTTGPNASNCEEQEKLVPSSFENVFHRQQATSLQRRS